MTDQLLEVREADAAPEIAAIYDEIHCAIGIPLVNLIYRHFAALPGALPWVWQVARQPIASGAIDAARTRLVAALEVPALDWLNRAAIDGTPLSQADIMAINAVLEVYNRGNTTNIIVLTAIKKLLDGTTSSESAAPASASEPSCVRFPAASIPPLPRIGDLSPEAAELVRGLAAQHSGADTNVIPSLYLHLAYWPSALRRIADRLRRSFEDGSIERATLLTRSIAWKEAIGLCHGMSVGSSPPPASLAQIRHVLELFTTRVIPEMVPIGIAIQRSLKISEPTLVASSLLEQ